ncbi:hypothetical protein ACROYT_G029639 [Oculina patagonica]
MIVFKDFISGDELFSDSYKMKVTDEGIFYEVEGKLTTEKGGIDESLIGGNKSAEAAEEDEGVEDKGVSGVNIVISNRLVEQTGVDKKSYQKYIKKYIAALVKRIEEERPGDVDKFKPNASKAVKRILGSFDDWQFFHGESDFDFDNEERAEGMLALMGSLKRNSSMYYILL